MPKKALSQKQKWFGILLMAPANAGWFCLLWNVFGVHSAVGLGTIGFLTALGVHYIAGVILWAASFYFWFARFAAKRYNYYA